MDRVKRFAARLRELRDRSTMSQEELSRKCGISVRSLSRLEGGSQEPTWPVAVSLAEALDVPTDTFLVEPGIVAKPRRGRPKGT